jgi:protein involved in polysaccharide export with SLBB domain
VRKPGTYQLKHGEDLGDLIETYAGGLTVNADATDVTVTRFSVDDDDISIVEFVNAVTNPEYELLDQDQVTVPNRNDYLPVVFFEGAVGGGDEELAEESTSDQVRYQFRPGETLSNAVRNIAGRFTPVSDLENAYLLRESVIGPIAVDLREFLYSRSLENDILLQPLDRIVVPFRQFFVTVSGAVALPGQYPYIPDRTFEYYLGLAGGTDPNRNIGSRPRITTVDGERRRPSDYIEPEDDVFFPTNNPLAYLSPFATVVGTTVSLVSLILTLTNN